MRVHCLGRDACRRHVRKQHLADSPWLADSLSSGGVEPTESTAVLLGEQLNACAVSDEVESRRKHAVRLVVG